MESKEAKISRYVHGGIRQLEKIQEVEKIESEESEMEE